VSTVKSNRLWSNTPFSIIMETAPSARRLRRDSLPSRLSLLESLRAFSRFLSSLSLLPNSLSDSVRCVFEGPWMACGAVVSRNRLLELPAGILPSACAEHAGRSSHERLLPRELDWLFEAS